MFKLVLIRLFDKIIFSIFMPPFTINLIMIRYPMRKLAILLLLVALLQGIEITQMLEAPPQTHIGNEAIACHTDSAPQVTNGFATYFSDNTYAC